LSSAGVLELRQYTLKPGARPDLVRLFEGELVEPQEAAGMRLGGLFLDRDDPDRFVWFRGFEDVSARRLALESFYDGPVWKQFRDAANATMLDSDDVLLLRPTEPARPAPDPAAERPAADTAGPSDAWVTVSVYVHPPDPHLTTWLTEEFHAAAEQQLRVPVATYRTEPAENNFPALPVRPDNVFVWMAAFTGQQEYVVARRRLEESRAWQNDISPRLEAQLTARQYLRLRPTARSQHPANGVGFSGQPRSSTRA
jgi:hypothetical protein